MKPVMKRPTFIASFDKKERHVVFDATPEAYRDISTLISRPVQDTGCNHIAIFSGQYDFDEVIDYIKNWTPEEEKPEAR